MPEDFKVTKKIVYAYLEGGGDLEDIPEEFINDKTLLLSLKHVKEDSDREYSLQKAIEKINKPISLQLASKILRLTTVLLQNLKQIGFPLLIGMNCLPIAKSLKLCLLN